MRFGDTREALWRAVGSRLFGARRALLATGLVGALLLGRGTALAEREHTVAKGQTLARIADKYGIKVSSLAAANGLTRTQPLREGQVLVVPARGVVYVAPGDTLAALAKRNDVTPEELARLNHLPKGAMLRAGQRLVLPGYEAAREIAAAEKRWGAPKRLGIATLHRLSKRGIHKIRFIDARGRVRPGALRQLALLMRPRDVRRARDPHPRLARLLSRISDHFGGRAIHIVSGFRKPGGYTRATSRHVAGHALDFRIDGVPLEALRDYCGKLDHVGVGYYPRSNFVHLDVRRTNARWTDLSGPGEAPLVLRPGNNAPDLELADEPAAQDDGQPPIDDSPPEPPGTPKLTGSAPATL